MLDQPADLSYDPRHSKDGMDGVNRARQRNLRPKSSGYSREAQIAQQRRLEAEARRKIREEKDRDRRAMLKARKPSKDGKYRLGRQSKILLHRVRRMVAEG